MRRNHQAQATVEPSWWSHDALDPASPDDHTDLDSHTPDPPEYDLAPEAEPPLLTHTPPLRLIDPEAPAATSPAPPAAAPVPQLAPPVPFPVISGPEPADGIPDPASAQLATCYAIDYLSWDATNPDRRATALARYLPRNTPTHPRATGWSGRGRQRATFAVTGASHRDDQDPSVLWIDIRVLITCYQPDPAAPRAVPAADPGELASDISSAPAPDAPGWRALDSNWVHIEVPLIHDESRQQHIRPDLQPTTHQPTDHERHSLTVVPAALTEGE